MAATMEPLERFADSQRIELGPFRAAVAALADVGVVDAAPKMAQRVGWRLSIGQPLDVAVRISVDELLEEAPRNSL